MAVVAQDNITVKLLSNQDELVQQYVNITEGGATLKASWTELKNGGIDTLEFSLSRNFNLLFYPGMQVYIYKNDEVLASAYSKVIPEPETSEERITVECLGWKYKLKDKQFTGTFTGVLLTAVIAALEPSLEAVGLLYDVAKIAVPNMTVDMVFEDNSLEEVISIIVKVANLNIDVTEYRWFIDTEKKLNFEIVRASVDNLFEGWNYQNPKVELDDSKLVNRMHIFEMDTGSGDTPVYITTYEDTGSQGQYGIKEQSLIIPIGGNITNANRIAQSFVKYFKAPKKTIEIEDFYFKNLTFGKYGLSNRRTNFWNLLSECDSLEGWDFSLSPNTTFVLDDEHVLTGNLALKIATLAGSLGESFEFVPDRNLYTCRKFAMRLYTDVSYPLGIELHAVNGDITTFTLGVTTANLLVTNPPTVVNDYLNLNPISAPSGRMGVRIQQAYTDQWILIEVDLDIFALEKVVFKLNDGSINSMWFDRLEVLTESPVYSELVLEEKGVTVNNLTIKQSAAFGNRGPSVVEEIQNKVEKGDTLYSALSKGVI